MCIRLLPYIWSSREISMSSFKKSKDYEKWTKRPENSSTALKVVKTREPFIFSKLGKTFFIDAILTFISQMYFIKILFNRFWTLLWEWGFSVCNSGRRDHERVLGDRLGLGRRHRQRGQAWCLDLWTPARLDNRQHWSLPEISFQSKVALHPPRSELALHSS